MESLVEQEKVRYLGVSNISLGQLVKLNSISSIKPKFVQNRCYARSLWDKEVRDYCSSENIIYQGFSLLTANQHELSHPEFTILANRYNKTIPQVIFAFCLQLGMLPLTGTRNANHMKQDLDSNDFELSNDELLLIENITYN